MVLLDPKFSPNLAHDPIRGEDDRFKFVHGLLRHRLLDDQDVDQPRSDLKFDKVGWKWLRAKRLSPEVVMKIDEGTGHRRVLHEQQLRPQSFDRHVLSDQLLRRSSLSQSS